jgi:type I restriction enzyme R subunit
LRSKKELIEEFVKRMNVESDIRWEGYIKSKKIEELKQIIKDEKLKEKETIEYINECFRDGEVIENGPKIREIMPPASPFTKNTIIKKMNVLQKINYFFTKFFDISPSKID